jgi:hypothetical protein
VGIKVGLSLYVVNAHLSGSGFYSYSLLEIKTCFPNSKKLINQPRQHHDKNEEEKGKGKNCR